MLLPSALPCSTRAQQAYPHLVPSLLPSPFLSQTTFPNENASILTSGIVNTCRTLQNLLSIPTAHNYYDTITTTAAKTNGSVKSHEPPTSARAYHEEIRRGLERVPIKRGSTRSLKGENKRDLAYPEEKEAEKPAGIPRSTKKRGRDQGDDVKIAASMSGFSTPKRRRYGPADLPLGLGRADFYALQTIETKNLVKEKRLPDMEEKKPQIFQGEEWDSEEDRILVDLVLEKLKLPRRDWDECARVLGREGASLGRRWKYLVGEGEVGIKFRKGRKGRKSLNSVWSTDQLKKAE